MINFEVYNDSPYRRVYINGLDPLPSRILPKDFYLLAAPISSPVT
jgi:hypothetical protein